MLLQQQAILRQKLTAATPKTSTFSHVSPQKMSTHFFLPRPQYNHPFWKIDKVIVFWVGKERRDENWDMRNSTLIKLSMKTSTNDLKWYFTSRFNVSILLYEMKQTQKKCSSNHALNKRNKLFFFPRGSTFRGVKKEQSCWWNVKSEYTCGT